MSTNQETDSMNSPAISIAFTPDPHPQAAIELAESARARGARALLLLAADGNDCTPAAFDEWLQGLAIPVCGGVFPQLIHGQCNYEHGYIVAGFSEPVVVHNIADLSDASADYVEALEKSFAHEVSAVSLLVLVDGLSSRIGALLDSVYDTLGSAPTYFGGGAGTLSFQRKPCLFSNHGMLSDHAQLVVLPWRFDLGVEHGWEKFAGPFVVTGARSNVIDTLDFAPAFEVYRKHVEADSGRQFDDDNFFDIAKGYPFGMEKPDGRIVVRDPITHTGTSMNCVGEVPANSVVHLLKGRPARLIEAAACGASSISPGHGPAILADCISRVLFLQSDFAGELQAAKGALGDRPLFGMLTLGEIANGGDYCLEFYNKTFVLAATQD